MNGPNAPEGDFITGGILVGRAVITSSFTQKRDNGLGYHGAHDKVTVFGDDAVRVRSAAWLELVGLWNGVVGPGGSYGNNALVRYVDGESGRMAHLRRFSDKIQRYIDSGYNPELLPYFEADEIIGWEGNTGNVWGWRPDGTIGAPVDANDTVTGKHLHYEHRDRGGLLIDPGARYAAMWDTVGDGAEQPVVEPVPEPNPYQNTPPDLTGAAALLEARMAFRLSEFFVTNPVPYSDMVEAFIAEAREMEQSFRVRPAIAEVIALQGLLEALAANPGDYLETLAAIQRELTEIIFILQAEVA